MKRLCSLYYMVLTLFGALNIKRVLGFMFGVLASLWMAAPAAAWGNLNDSSEPGSVLVFPKFIRGTFNDFGLSGQLVHAVTELEISVTCPNGSSCATSGQVVNLMARWVCPGCSESSFALQTTVGGTLYFNPEGVTVLLGLITANAFPSNVTTTIPVPPCQRGYLIVWVVDGNGNPIKFDGLIGDAVIRSIPLVPFATFPHAGRAYNAIPIQADPALNTGDFTAANTNGALAFDGSGSHYQEVTGRIFGTVRYENAVLPEGNVQTDLTLLTLDATLNLLNPTTTVGLDFYTPNEEIVDTSTSFACWEEKRLTDINATLTTQRMGRKGLVTSTSAQQQLDFFTTVPVTLLGLVETMEFDTFTFEVRDYSYLLYNDSNPVPTTFVP